MSRIEDLNRLLNEKLTNAFRKGYINVKGYCLPERFTEIANAIENFDVRDQDVWVCSFPKAGTTWIQEMVWCIDNDFDFEGAKVLLSRRFPFLEATAICYRYTTSDNGPNMINFKEELVDSIGFIDQMPNPRYIKTHLPFDLLPREIRTGERKPKIIYLMRNPKDTCISYYHHCRRMLFDKLTFTEFCHLFYAGKVTFGPYWDHLLSYWSQRKRQNVFILEFEEIILNLPTVIRKIAGFLGKKVKEEDLKKLTEHLSFENFRANPAVNHEHIIEPFTKYSASKIETKYMRRGTIGQWNEFMSSEVIDEIDKLTAEKFSGSGLHY